MVLREWLRRPRQGTRPGQPLCKVDIDGETRTICADIREEGALLFLYVEPGEEIPLEGSLCAYSTSGAYNDNPPDEVRRDISG